MNVDIDRAVLERMGDAPDGFIPKGDIVIRISESIEEPGVTSVGHGYSDALNVWEAIALLNHVARVYERNCIPVDE